MRRMKLELGDQVSEIVVGKGILKEEISSLTNKVLVVYPSSLSELLKAVPQDLGKLSVPDGEEAKDLDNVLGLVSVLFERGFTRKDYLVAIGGGTVMDMAGFAGSIYMRGLNVVNVPTTLLGMVDASLGGKNGVNYRGIKNMIGTFFHPRMVISDLDFLSSLPDQEFVRGMAEVIKYGLSLDSELYSLLVNDKEGILQRKDEGLLETVVYKSVEDKMSVVRDDPRENRGIRIVLNFGHTVGHAIESATDFMVSHGEAISVGMVCESKIAEELGYAEEGVVEDVMFLLSQYGLPVDVDSLQVKPRMEKALSAILKDKKSTEEGVNMPLVTRIGNWKRVVIGYDTLKGYVRQCLSPSG